MKKVLARTLLKFSTDQLWDNLEGTFIIVFDDNSEIVTNEKEVIYSSYFWEYHRLYGNTPILANHHVKGVIGSKKLGSNTHLNLVGNVLWSVYDCYKADIVDKVKFIDDLTKLAYEIINHVYNELTYKLEEYVTSIDLINFIEVFNHPEINKAVLNTAPTEEGISKTYEHIKSTVNNNDLFIENPLIDAVRARIVNVNQFLQCVSPRGYLTDIDSNRFNKPILRGFLQGLRSIEDSLMESRSSAKALIFAKDNLQKSEYFSRRQQLICQTLQRIHRCDCGSKHYLTWQVREEVDETGLKINDLPNIEGKYYLDEITNTLKIVNISDRHLIGTTIKLRSPIAGCMVRDEYGICEVCFGENSLAIPEATNLGHACCTTLTEKISQNVMSTKHLDGSAKIEGIYLSDFDKKYINAPSNGNLYFLNESLFNNKISIILPTISAPGMSDVSNVDDVKSLNASRVSRFSRIKLMIESKDGTDIIPLEVCINKRLSNATHEFLAFIKSNGWGITENEEYVIDMTGWNFRQPLLSLPMTHVNMSDHQGEISAILESTVENLTYRDTVASPEATVVELFDLVNKRLTVNLAILEVALYSSMIVSAESGDYSLPKPWTDRGLGIMTKTMNYRSMGPDMAFQEHRQTLTDPVSYIMKNKPDHIFDTILMPNETLGPKYGTSIS